MHLFKLKKKLTSHFYHKNFFKFVKQNFMFYMFMEKGNKLKILKIENFIK